MVSPGAAWFIADWMLSPSETVIVAADAQLTVCQARQMRANARTVQLQMRALNRDVRSLLQMGYGVCR